MHRLRLVLCSAAIAALLPVAACSHGGGRLAFNGADGGASGAGAPNAPGDGGGSGEPGDPGGPGDPDGPGAQPQLAELVGTGVVQPLLATSGNLISTLRTGQPDLTDDVDPLTRVTVGSNTLLGTADGQGRPSVGVNVGNDAQTDGNLATLGVLNNGQILAANAVGPAGSPDLIGATANGDQLIGQGQQQQIGVGLLSPTPTHGDVASVNVLTGGDIVGVHVPGATPGGGLVQGVTNTVGGVLPGGTPAPGVGNVVGGVVNTVGNVLPGGAPAPGGTPLGGLVGGVLGGLTP